MVDLEPFVGDSGLHRADVGYILLVFELELLGEPCRNILERTVLHGEVDLHAGDTGADESGIRDTDGHIIGFLLLETVDHRYVIVDVVGEFHFRCVRAERA